MANRKRRCTWITKHRYIKRTRRCEGQAISEIPVQFNRYGNEVTWVCEEHMTEFNEWLVRRVDAHASMINA
jgi:hypothetical protein